MLLLAALLAWAPPVQRPHDRPPTLALSWATAGASACPSRSELIERIGGQGVSEQLGEWIPERHDRAKLEVEVEIAVVGERWQASLSLTDADGRSQRSFSAQSCAALADATALIIAVTLDPVAVASVHASVPARREPEPPKPEPEPPKPEPEPEPPINLTLSDDDPGPQRWPEGLRVGVSIHGGGGWGPIADFTAAIGGRVSLFGERWRAELGGRWAIPRRIEQAGGAGVFDAWMIEGRGCFVPSVRVLEFPLCPGIELGSVRGSGVPPTRDPLQQSFLWVAPTLSQGLTWAPIDRLAIGVELGLVAPLTRGRFVVADLPIEDLARIGGRALLSLELRLK
jgi:hypothetical protein